jgi:hypothetical protein
MGEVVFKENITEITCLIANIFFSPIPNKCIAKILQFIIRFRKLVIIDNSKKIILSIEIEL